MNNLQSKIDSLLFHDQSSLFFTPVAPFPTISIQTPSNAVLLACTKRQEHIVVIGLLSSRKGVEVEPKKGIVAICLNQMGNSNFIHFHCYRRRRSKGRTGNFLLPDQHIGPLRAVKRVIVVLRSHFSVLVVSESKIY